MEPSGPVCLDAAQLDLKSALAHVKLAVII